MPRSLLLLPLLAACVGSGELPAQISGQIVGVAGQPIGPGVVLIERGEVHAGSYVYGARIDQLGRFTTPLPVPGRYGLHLFRDDYQYLPMQIEIAENQQILLTSMMVEWGIWMDLAGQPTWPTQPADPTLILMPWDELKEDNPVLEDVRMRYDGAFVDIEADVFDPDGDLSRMILAYDQATGAGYALNPPEPPNAAGQFPNGTYSLRVYLDEAHRPGESKWFFVVSDNLCNDTDILTITMPPR